jgi:hypothetical protein
MSATLDKIKEEMNHLAPEELREVRELADSLLSEPEAGPQTEDEREDAFERELAAEGFIAPVEPPATTDEAVREFRAYKPITVEGQPLSEMIIEERR